MVRLGPVMPDGRQQRQQSSAGHWVSTSSYLLLLPKVLREFRSYVTKMQGGAAEFIMPVHDRSRAPWPPGVTYATAKPAVVFAAGGNATLQAQQIRVRSLAAFPAGSTKILVQVVLGGRLMRGHYFSVWDKGGRARLHQIDAAPGNLQQGASGWISIQPPLRSKIRDNHVLDFDDPACTMTLAETDGGLVTETAQEGATATLTLRESFGGV
jgi:hypothetical protein